MSGVLLDQIERFQQTIDAGETPDVHDAIVLVLLLLLQLEEALRWETEVTAWFEMLGELAKDGVTLKTAFVN
jgi:hypothetical protein